MFPNKIPSKTSPYSYGGLGKSFLTQKKNCAPEISAGRYRDGSKLNLKFSISTQTAVTMKLQDLPNFLESRPCTMCGNGSIGTARSNEK